MIVVKIEMYPKGKKEGKYLLGTVVIANDGTGTLDLGNYTYALSHAGKFLGKRKEPFKQGQVKKFPRKLSPYRLLSRVLASAGET